MTISYDTAATTRSAMRVTRIGPGDWLIHDDSLPREDPRCLIASVRDGGEGAVEVVWLNWLRLAGTFATVHDVLSAVEGWSQLEKGATT